MKDMKVKEYIRLSVGTCEACDKTLDDSEMKIKGWNTGVELGLCRTCASFVNEPHQGEDSTDRFDGEVFEYTEEEYQQALLDYLAKKGVDTEE